MPKALLLSDGDLSPNDRNVGKLLDFFGIPWEIVTIRQIVANELSLGGMDCNKHCLLSSAPVMAEVLEGFNGSGASWSSLMERASSVFVYGFQETDSCRKLVRHLTGSKNANVSSPLSRQVLMSVSGDFSEMCGPMSGLQVPIVPTEADLVLDLKAECTSFQRIVTTPAGEVFGRVAYGTVPFFLSGCRDIIDIDTPARKPFDVKKCFCSAVPIVMYLTWAFADVCWRSAETRACLIVDDPLLKARYGFLRFRRALELMEEHNFTMSLAFIPWNQGRTDSKVVQLFRDRSDKFSLSIHGCDHTASEFATRSSAELNAKTKVAGRRMKMLQERTSLAHDRVMVFPQGEFSTETGRVLKLNGFVAAANTEVTPSHESGNDPRIADLWDIAIIRYGTFPIFTRRYFTQGLENFAFDILLGKPCLLVAHHQEFKDDARDLIGFIDRLNSLSCKLVWGSLGEVVRGGFRIRYRPDGTGNVRMYSNSVLAENTHSECCVIEFIKEEGDADCVSAVIVNQEATQWSCENGYLRFRVTIPPHAKADVVVVYVDKLGNGSYPSALRYKIKTCLRRYLSEARDQYFSQNDVLSNSAFRMRRVLRRTVS
jgi:hypothetical protein